MIDYCDLVYADGFDDCIIGVCTGYGREPCLAYDRGKVLGKLVDRDGMDLDEAVEFFDYNIEGGYIGSRTPVFIDTESWDIS